MLNEIQMSSDLIALDYSELISVDGGKWYTAVLTFMGGVSATVGSCALISGSSGTAIASMAVGSLAACGPVGWAVLGVAVVGGIATGCATVAAYKS